MHFLFAERRRPNRSCSLPSLVTTASSAWWRFPRSCSPRTSPGSWRSSCERSQGQHLPKLPFPSRFKSGRRRASSSSTSWSGGASRSTPPWRTTCPSSGCWERTAGRLAPAWPRLAPKLTASCSTKTCSKAEIITISSGL